MMKKRWVALSGIALVAIGCVYYSSQQTDKNAPSLPLITVKNATIEKQAIAVGHIVPSHSVQIKSQIEGMVGEIFHQVGDKVTAGTPLIKIKPNPTPQRLTQAKTELLTAQAQLGSAQQILTNLQQLVQSKVIPNNYGQYITAKSDVRRFKADVQQKQQNLDLIRSGESLIGSSKLTSIIVAPINGTILNLNVDVGEPITSTESSQSATEMMSLANMKNMIFQGSVSEHDAAKLSKGMPATLTLAPYPNSIITGKVKSVAVQSERLNDPSDTSTSFDNGFEVEVNHIAFPDKITLRSGFSSTAKITLQQAKDVATIPERALSFTKDTPHVFIPDNSKQGYHAKEVTLGLSDGINVAVLSGVKTGDKIVDASMIEASHNE